MLKAVSGSGEPALSLDDQANEVIDFLNRKCTKNFAKNDFNRAFIIKRMQMDGATVDTCKQLIAYLDLQWRNATFANGRSGRVYLRPETIFNQEKYNRYIGEIV